MQHKTTSQFASACGKALIFVENELPIGVFHDFLMQVKGAMVERMIKAHQEQVAEMEAQKEIDNPPEQEFACEGNSCSEGAKEA